MKIYQYLTRTFCTGVIRRTSATAVAVLMMASASFSHAENPRVVVEISGLGSIEIELLENLAPRTVSNFLTLVDEKFYDGLIFHRVIANFMIQGGGYTPDLKYKPGAKTVPNESFNGLKNSRGTIAMARLADPDSADTQFFINVRDNPNLDADGNKAGYTVFGRVSAGMEVVSKIELVNTHLRGGMAAVPEDSVIITKVERI
jgi:peptidyl-prolyl cis-trans isomerase A (cyclophilin A)